MKTLMTLIVALTLLVPLSTQAQGRKTRPDIEKEVPLAEALKRYNAEFPDANPLTEDEVIAAVRNMKSVDPKIKDPVYQVYQRVAKEKVLPPGMYLSHMSSLQSDGMHYDVDWKDLTLTSLPPGTKDEFIGYGYNYRIRARFISSQPGPANGGGLMVVPMGPGLAVPQPAKPEIR